MRDDERVKEEDESQGESGDDQVMVCTKRSRFCCEQRCVLKQNTSIKHLYNKQKQVISGDLFEN